MTVLRCCVCHKARCRCGREFIDTELAAYIDDLKADNARLREALDVIQSPLHIDGEEHRGAVLLARRVMKALAPRGGAA